VPSGAVISTSPAAGASVRHGEKVTIIPSLGPVLVQVPVVTGQSLTAAEQALKAAGFTAARATYQPSATIQQGIVSATNPAAYTQWPKDKPIEIVVSSGPPLPNFVGQPLAQVQAEAQQGGYNVSPQTDPSSSQAANTVLRQSPAAGTPIAPGEVVTVWVSAGPPLVNVPDVQGMSAHDARQALEAAGFQVTEAGGHFGGDQVTNYQPQGQQPQGTTITITIGLF
jgi:eukaryotic-like serine/threonine-protein kinase